MLALRASVFSFSLTRYNLRLSVGRSVRRVIYQTRSTISVVLTGKPLLARAGHSSSAVSMGEAHLEKRKTILDRYWKRRVKRAARILARKR